MKKNYLLIIIACLLYHTASMAQAVMPSGFSSTIATYTEITDGTVITIPEEFAETTAMTDKAFISTTEAVSALTTASGFPIGFDIQFNSINMNRFAINCYPQLVLGKDNVAVNPNRSGFWLTEGGEGKDNVVGVGLFAETYVYDDTEISYKLTGTAPNRVLIVQWKNLGLNTSWGSDYAKVNAQIHLHETSNEVKLVFGNWANTSSTARFTRVGIKGTGTDSHLRYSSTSDFTDTQFSATGTMSWNSSANIPDGLTYTFTPSADCETPTEQPTTLELMATSIGITGSFTETETADHYLIVMSSSAALSQTPVDGVHYSKNEEFGNGIVIDYTTGIEFATPTTLNSAATYYFHVFAANSYCSFEPKYNTASPLTGQIKTMPLMPESLGIVDNEYNSATIAVETNSIGQEVLIAMTDVPALNAYIQIIEGGTFGVPQGAYAINDIIEGGGAVVYKGGSSNNILVENLNDNTVYHFQAWTVDGEGNYSTTSVSESVLTWGKVPYKVDFTENRLPQYGWDMEGGSFQMSGKMITTSMTGSAVTPAIQSVTTQWILLGEGKNRVNFDYYMDVNSFAAFFDPLLAGAWEDDSSFEIQVSTDDVNYETVYTINKDNAVDFGGNVFQTLRIPAFDNFNGERAKVRFKWNFAQKVRTRITDILIEQVLDCDYPLDLKVDESTVFGQNATLTWIPRGDESVWDIRYRVIGAEEWILIEDVMNPSYQFTTLPAQSNIEAQVQAKCSATSVSHWSQPITFNSGFILPYYQDFAGTATPMGWEIFKGALADPTEFATPGYFDSKWTINNELYVTYSSGNAWALFPKFDLGDGSYHYQLEFDLTVEGEDNEGDNLYIVMSKDGGATFNTDDVIATIDLSNASLLDGEAHRQTVSLKGYEGGVRLAFYTGDGNGGTTVGIMDVAVVETCPPLAENAEAEDLTAESAKVSWEGVNDEWLVFVRKAEETTMDYQPQTANFIELSDLDAATTYEVGITHACGEDDMAKPLLVRFTTQAVDPCLEVENIEISSIGITTATISWTHEGIGFNVRYRKTGVEEWRTATAETTQVVLLNLEEDTEYEYQIQAICSEADGDISEWTAIATFHTLAITCFPPTNIVAVPTHKSAEITWEGDATDYEVAYRIGDAEWTVKEVSGKSTILEDLTANTEYSLRIRSKCSDTDISTWSAVQTFKTLQIPECVIPTNLQASEVTDNSALFTWQGDESNLSWNLRYRKNTVTSWTIANGLEEKSHSVNDLESNSLYLWSVRANCDEGRQSAWATQSEFNTTNVSIGQVGDDTFKVFMSGKTLNIINPERIYVKQIQLLSTSGALIHSFDANSNDNMMIPLSIDSKQAIIVRIIGINYSYSSKIVIK